MNCLYCYKLVPNLQEEYTIFEHYNCLNCNISFRYYVDSLYEIRLYYQHDDKLFIVYQLKQNGIWTNTRIYLSDPDLSPNMQIYVKPLFEFSSKLEVDPDTVQQKNF